MSERNSWAMCAAAATKMWAAATAPDHGIRQVLGATQCETIC
jgi:hypothetical protein